MNYARESPCSFMEIVKSGIFIFYLSQLVGRLNKLKLIIINDKKCYASGSVKSEQETVHICRHGTLENS